MKLTIDQLRQIMPFAGPRAAVYLDPLNAAMVEFGIDTPARVGMFLANVAHESGSLRYTREIASGAAYDNRADLGNTRPDAIVIAGQHGGHGNLGDTGMKLTIATTS
jgi:putative chitinase